MNKRLLAMLVPALFAQSYIVPADAGAAETLLDMDSILGQSIDEVPDAPEYVTPPDGSYTLLVKEAKSEEYKRDNKETGVEEKKLRLKIVYEVVQTIELADAEEPPVAAKSLFSEQFMTNPDGLSYFKRQAKNILGAETIKGATIGDILKSLPSASEFTAKVRIKKTPGKDADGKRKVYSNVQVRVEGAADAAEGVAA